MNETASSILVGVVIGGLALMLIDILATIYVYMERMNLRTVVKMFELGVSVVLCVALIVNAVLTAMSLMK